MVANISRTTAAAATTPTTTSAQLQCNDDVFTLNPEQATIYDLVVNHRTNVFINGKAGVGKTYLLHRIYEGLKNEGYEVITVAFTGKAASILPGKPTTASRCVGMRRGTADYLPEGYTDAKPWNHVIRKAAMDSYRNADDRWTDPKLAVIIDEAGQLSSENAWLFYQMGMYKRATVTGLRSPLWIFSADIGQLQAVEGSWIFNPASIKYWETESKVGTISYPSLLSELKVHTVNLTTIIRQQEAEYQKALKWVYYGIALHPMFKERLKAEPPENTTGIYFNNDFVIQENNAYTEYYLREHPNAKRKTYHAITENITEADLKYLAPVQERMTIAVGMPFLCTENVPDRGNGKRLMVANGEQVTVVDVKERCIKVRKHNGIEVELDYVEHSLPNSSKAGVHKDSKRKVSFLQLPGYAGPSISLYKIQGTTIETPRIYGAYEVRKGKRYPLNERPGAMYVMLSRNTKLSDLYFDTSFGVDEAEHLLKSSISHSPQVLRYLLKERRPLWATDYNKEKFVLELLSVRAEPEVFKYNCYLCKFELTELHNGHVSRYYIRYLESKDTLIRAASFQVVDEYTHDLHKLDNPPYSKHFDSIALCWYYDWLPHNTFSNFF